MANPEHLEILKQGAKVWNEWREKEGFRNRLDLNDVVLESIDLTGANLSDVECVDSKFRWVTFRGADMRRISLNGSDLTGSDLRGANLNVAALNGANLQLSNLEDASLREAELYTANFSGAYLKNADFYRARIGGTLFGDCELSSTKGLDNLRTSGPSTLGVDTIFRSAGKIPEAFLRGCGVPENFIVQMHALVASIQPIEFYSCFISYSHKDEDFARRLHSRMREANLRVWYAPEEMKGGRKLHEQIYEAIHVYDKLLLVLSENSLQSEWVATEIRRAKKSEREGNRRKLFPIRLVDFEAIAKWEHFDADSGKDLGVELREYFIPDFSNWKDHDSFEKAFERLLRDLKAEEKKA